MGMFDYLKCEYPPHRQSDFLSRDWRENDLQGDDFDCWLAYEFTSRLQRERRERFPKTWIGRRVYPVYAWMVHTLGCLVRQFCHAVGKLSQSASRSLDRLVVTLAPYGDPIRARQHQRRTNNT